MTKRIPHQEEAINGNNLVETYAREHEENSQSHFSAFLNDLEKLNPRGRFLEIGSGPGFLTALVAEKYPQSTIVALEPSKEMIDYAKTFRKTKGLDNRIEFVQGSIDDETKVKKLGQFDLVYSTFSLHHWTNPQQAWRMISKTVKSSGTIFIHDLKRVSWLYHLPFKNGFFESIRAAYIPREIGYMLKYAGIRNYKIKTPFPYFWMSIIADKSHKTV
ncbi:methyltransferase domain-containing protein [bacterium]|nr:methyltransferase domain-containing protein [bacterium]